MKNISAIVVLGLAIILISCNSKTKRSIVTNFTREDFRAQITLVNPEEIIWNDLSGISNPASVILLHDSVLLVQNQPGKQFGIELYSLYSRNPLAYLTHVGRGPGEFISCSYIGHSVDQSEIYLKDIQTRTYYVVNFLKILESGEIAIKRQFRYDPEVYMNSELLILDENHYTGYNMWYIDNSQYSNNVAALTRYEIEPETIQTSPRTNDHMMGYKYFVGPANGARLLLNPDNRNIWLFDQRRDRIEIFNDSLKQIKTLCGPDNYNVKYVAQQSANVSFQFVGFEDGKEYQSYIDYAYNDKHIYAVYAGTDSYDISQLPAVEIFKMDWQGNLLCNYKLDRFISGISIDSREEYLYGTTRESFLDTLQFVRYKL